VIFLSLWNFLDVFKILKLLLFGLEPIPLV
jgi:hypothetical protein